VASFILIFCAAAAPAAETRIGPKGQVYVDGKPAVPLAVWNQPAHLFGYHRQLGIRCIVGPTDESEFFQPPHPTPLAAAEAAGVAVLANQLVAPRARGPVWGYLDGVADPRRPDAMQGGYRRLREGDPNHFAMINIPIHGFLRGQDANGYAQALRHTDAVISHVWPQCLDANNPNLRNVGDFVDLVRRYCKDRPGGEVSIWPDINPHAWRPPRGRRGADRILPAPTREELRFQIWLALIHGADAICLFPITFDPFVFAQIPAQSEHEISWNAALMERMAPVLAAGESNLKIETTTDRPGGILDVTTRTLDGRHYVLLLNGGREEQTVTLKVPGLGSEWKLNDVVNKKPIAVTGETYVEKLRGLALRIWELAPAAEAK